MGRMEVVLGRRGWSKMLLPKQHPFSVFSELASVTVTGARPTKPCERPSVDATLRVGRRWIPDGFESGSEDDPADFTDVEDADAAD